MALKFRMNFIDKAKDVEPTVSKTVKRVISAMKEIFFDQSHDYIRNAVANSMYEILENCFIDKRYGKDSKKASDLIFNPLFDELIPEKKQVKSIIARQSALFVLRYLHDKYKDDLSIVNPRHCHTFVCLGIKHRIYDGEFLWAVADLLDVHGIATTCADCLWKAVTHFINSIKFNMTGQNAPQGKVHRDRQVVASLLVLTSFARRIVSQQAGDAEFADLVFPKFKTPLYEALALLNGESNQILKVRQETIQYWQQLEELVQENTRLKNAESLRNFQVQSGELEVQNQAQMADLQNQRQKFDHVYANAEPKLEKYTSGNFGGTLSEVTTETVPLSFEPVIQQKGPKNDNTQLNSNIPYFVANQSSFGNLNEPIRAELTKSSGTDTATKAANTMLQNQMLEIQGNIQKSLGAIQRKMTNIEQKVFATQKNMDSIQKEQNESSGKSQKDESEQLPRKKQEQDTLKLMLVALQNQ